MSEPINEKDLPDIAVKARRASVDEQREGFARLREQLGSASPEENRRALAELREPGSPDPELTPELVQRYQNLLARS